jgi:hypothetical protein
MYKRNKQIFKIENEEKIKLGIEWPKRKLNA